MARLTENKIPLLTSKIYQETVPLSFSDILKAKRNNKFNRLKPCFLLLQPVHSARKLVFLGKSFVGKILVSPVIEELREQF